MDKDYREMLSAFSNEGVEYLVVGAYALQRGWLPSLGRQDLHHVR